MLTNVRPGWAYLTIRNTSPYFSAKLIPSLKIFRGHTLGLTSALLTNVRLGWESLTMTSTLVYNCTKLITAVKKVLEDRPWDKLWPYSQMLD